MTAFAFCRYCFCVMLMNMLLACSQTPGETPNSRVMPAGDERVPIEDIGLFEANDLFNGYTAVDGVAMVQMRAILGVAMRNNNILENVEKRVDNSNNDDLARDFISSFDGVTSSMITLYVFRQFLEPRDEEDFLRKSSKIFNIIHSPDGRKVRIPISYAPIFHSYHMVTIGKELEEREQWIDVKGQYQLWTHGLCPFPSGPIELRQRQFMVEGVRDGKLVLAGALGKSEHYFIANEERYMSARQDTSGRVALEAPDRSSELYLVTSNGKELQFTGQIYGECKFILYPAS